MADRLSGNCCQEAECAANSYDTIGKWSTGVGGTITDAGMFWVTPNEQIQTFNVDGEVNPAFFVTGKEAWEIRFYMRGQATFTIDSVELVIDTDAQTITVDGHTDSIGQFERHLPSDDLFLFRLRVTPTHAYLLGYGNYQVGTVFGAESNAHSILTVDRSSDAPDSFSVVWTDATIGGFTISESTVTVTDDYVPSFERLCWTEPSLECPYFMVKQMTQNHLYQDDPGYNRDYYVADITSTGWDPWGWIFSDCMVPSPIAWASGTVLTGPPSWPFPDAPDPTETLQTHQFSNPCGQGGSFVRWVDEGGGSYSYKTIDLAVYDAGFTYAAQLALTWPTPTFSQPYPKPHYTASFSTQFTHINQFSCGVGNNCNLNIVSDGSASADIACNDLQNGFTLSVSGTLSYDANDDGVPVDPPDEMDFQIRTSCTIETKTPDEILGYYGTVGGTWTV
ncbi:hypothetical protein Enr13x_07360 [Stieleria neptunia]|uniref:Uncharacterized protein n=1 Tax=Stieleria neptunia TaxID=2527979 RepID=A0A518HJF5_9BACT|nr:hypothetical protein [Stieleria neptunia]QDV40900.1 hypothetical protein Enr13x_07360 [Stieleria neptunia]